MKKEKGKEVETSKTLKLNIMTVKFRGKLHTLLNTSIEIGSTLVLKNAKNPWKNMIT